MGSKLLSRAQGLSGTELVVLFAILVPLLFVVAWGFCALWVFIGLNLIAGFSLSFAKVVGIAFVLLMCASNATVSKS